MDINIKDNILNSRQAFLEGLRKASNESKITLIADTQEVTPVKTGRLKRSITGHYRVTNDGKINITIGSPVIYACKVEFKDKSYLRATLDRDLSKISEIFNKRLEEVK